MLLLAYKLGECTHWLPVPNAFSGERRFSVSITPQTKSSKNLDYVVNVCFTFVLPRLCFLHLLMLLIQKCKGGMTLYSKSDLMVPFVFSFTENMDPSTRIRVRAEYTEERYANKAVERCPNHQFKDSKSFSLHSRRSLYLCRRLCGIIITTNIHQCA